MSDLFNDAGLDEHIKYHSGYQISIACKWCKQRSLAREAAAQHKNRALTNTTQQPVVAYGWICLRCGRGNAPFNNSCDCLHVEGFYKGPTC